MTSNRFGNLFDDDSESEIMQRVNEIEIKLSRVSEYKDDETGDTEPAGIIGSFKLIGDIGSLNDNATPDDLAFVRKLMSRFEEVTK